MNTKSNAINSESLLAVKDRRVAGILMDFESLLQKHLHETVEAQTVKYLLYIASKDEPVDISNVGAALGLSKAGSSRNYYRLADGRNGTDGLNLIKSLVDYNDRRRMLLTLTPKGAEVAQELISFITDKLRKVLLPTTT
jgi:DNA-binding MarR family transcriptional regulator